MGKIWIQTKIYHLQNLLKGHGQTSPFAKIENPMIIIKNSANSFLVVKYLPTSDDTTGHIKEQDLDLL